MMPSSSLNLHASDGEVRRFLLDRERRHDGTERYAIERYLDDRPGTAFLRRAMPRARFMPLTVPGQLRYNTASFLKPNVTVAGGSGAWLTANSPITLFTVTGFVLCRVYGRVTTAVTSTAGTGTLAVGIAGTTGLFIAATTANGAANFILNSVWNDNAPTVTGKALAAINSQGGWLDLSNANIILTIATNNMTAGGVELYCDWVPVSAGATVVAAAP